MKTTHFYIIFNVIFCLWLFSHLFSCWLFFLLNFIWNSQKNNYLILQCFGFSITMFKLILCGNSKNICYICIYDLNRLLMHSVCSMFIVIISLQFLDSIAELLSYCNYGLIMVGCDYRAVNLPFGQRMLHSKCKVFY